MFFPERDHRGVTLLETVIYTGLFAIILPATAVFFLQFTQSGETFARRAQMEQTGALVLSHLNTELSRAQTWDLGGSTLGSSEGAFVYVNDEGQNVVVDRVLDVVAFDGTDQNVGRIRVTVGTNPAEWITPREIHVSTFRLDEVRDSSGVVTGMSLSVEFQMLNAGGGPFRGAEFSSQTTFALRPATISI